MANAATRTTTAARRTQAPSVYLSSRTLIDKHEANLTSVEGARELIDAIKERKSVTKLVLGHNHLGDDGCKELFRFLGSPDGRRYRVAEIALNSNGIGDEGLEAIADYLVGNEHLKELFLQNNAFQGDESVALKLSIAINSSKLEFISLVANQQLSDFFFDVFLSHLDSPTLRELHIPGLGLTPVSAPMLISFLTSRRSRALESLKCNGNNLGWQSAYTLIWALRKANFNIQKLEIHASGLDFDFGLAPSASIVRALSENPAFLTAVSVEKELRTVLVRNEILRRKVHEAALSLLSYSRTILLSTTSHTFSGLVSSPPDSQLLWKSSDPPIPASASTFPFKTLPIELQYSILSFLAPALSAAQCLRIFAFASSPTTLHPLLPRLKAGSAAAGAHQGCIPDPASLPFGMMGGPGSGPCPGAKGPDLWLVGAPTPRLCAGGRCMGAGGSVHCHRNEARTRWLEEVRCTRFEADGRLEADVLRLL